MQWKCVFCLPELFLLYSPKMQQKNKILSAWESVVKSSWTSMKPGSAQNTLYEGEAQALFFTMKWSVY